MNNAVKLRYYIESLCIYDLKNDEVIASLLDLLASTKTEAVLKKQGAFFNRVSEHGSLKSYISRLILSDDNIFTKASASGKADRLSESVLYGVKSDLKKLGKTVLPFFLLKKTGILSLARFPIITNQTATVCFLNTRRFRGASTLFFRFPQQPIYVLRI